MEAGQELRGGENAVSANALTLHARVADFDAFVVWIAIMN